MRKVGFVLGGMTLVLAGSLSAGCLGASSDCGLFFNCAPSGGGGEGAGGEHRRHRGNAPTCDDGISNGGESDVDCGQVCPEQCVVGQKCEVGADCASTLFCSNEKTCRDLECGDNVKNGDESDVDCGGSECNRCDPGQSCNQDSDCKGEVCEGKVCQENCEDGILNNGETDIDCGGTAGCPKCDDGRKCQSGDDCKNASCPDQDKVCCNAPCDGECVACLATKTGGPDGTCAAVSSGTDPDDDCEPEGPSTCGNSDGACNGLGTCNKHPAGTACGDSQACTQGIQTNQDMCDGAGICVDKGEMLCNYFLCDGTSCKTVCAADSDCTVFGYCSVVGQCIVKKALGTECAGANECLGGHCTDGVCCNEACGSICKSCNLMGSVGTCTFIPNGQDPADECLGNNGAAVCNGNGVCKKGDSGAPCGTSEECNSTFCVDGVCCDKPCGGNCEACTSALKGQGADGTCGFIKKGDDPQSECRNVPPYSVSCDGAGMCKEQDGSACQMASECLSGFCVDGRCCDTACTGTCKTCGNGNGICSNVPDGTDPAEECSGSQVCNNGMCANP